MLTLASILLAAAVAPASPAPQPTLAPYTWSGAIYAGKPTVYFMFVRAKDTPTKTLHGYIAQYGLLTEHDTKYPIAFIGFVEDGTQVLREIDIAEPLQINGRTYMCGGGKTTFERLYNVCPSLPADVMGASHEVSVTIFVGHFPDGKPTTVTDSVQSTP